MDIRTLFRADKIAFYYNETHVINLSFSIKDGMFTVVRCLHPDIISDFLLGKAMPDKGIIGLAGVNIFERNFNERRVFEIPNIINSMSTDELLTLVLNDRVQVPSVFELKKRAKMEEISKLKKQLKKCNPDERTELDEKLKKAKADAIVLSFKIERRLSELEQNMKTAEALLKSMNNDKLVYGDDKVDKMRAKAFSAEYEYALFSHDKMPKQVVSERVRYVKNMLELDDTVLSGNMLYNYACAYVKAPQLMVYSAGSGVPDIELLNLFDMLTKKYGITIVVIAGKEYNASSSHILDISDECFRTDCEQTSNMVSQ